MTQLHANQLSSMDRNYASVTEATVTNRFGAANRIDEHDSEKFIVNNADSEEADQERPRFINLNDDQPVKIEVHDQGKDTIGDDIDDDDNDKKIV